MKLDGNNIIDYNNIPTSKPKSVSLNGIIYDARNPFWELEEGSETSKLANAIEIAWNGAGIQMDEEIKPINITSELLDWIQNMVNGKRFLNLLIEFIKSNSLEVVPTKDKLYLELRKPYYWYVGDTIPTSLPTNDSNLATGTNPGWRKIGNSKPIAETKIFSDDNTIIVSTTKVPIYIAVNSDISLNFVDGFNNQLENFVGDPIISNGMKIYTTLFKAKSFNGNVKILI